MKNKIIILGAGVMQGPAIKSAKGLGLETVVVDGNKDAPYAGLADQFFHTDLKDKEGVLELGKKLKLEGRLLGIMTAGTDFSATVAYTAENLGLPGIPYQAALDASDKARMRARFKAAGVPSPNFVVIEKSAPTPVLPFDFPVVVKPVDNMGSRGCRRVDCRDELVSAVHDAMAFSLSGRVIAEEFMEGREFSVDAIVSNGEVTICGLADRHIFFPPYFIEMGHTMPTEISGVDAGKILDTFKRGIKSLGITLGAAKGDIKLTPKGPMIGEIAARLSGGYMSGWTYPYSSGVNPSRAAVLAAIGQKPDGLTPTRDYVSAERAFISIPGIISEIKGADCAENIEYIEKVFFRTAVNDKVCFPENNITKCGNVISCAPVRGDAVDAAESAVKAILLRLTAPNEETEEFLSGFFNKNGNTGGVSVRYNFPPDAFKAEGSILTELEKLPQDADGVAGEAAICPFPAFFDSGLKDYVGRNCAETLEAVRIVTGQALPIAASNVPAAFGREFWQAVIRGGYQGGAYIVDKKLLVKKRFVE